MQKSSLYFEVFLVLAPGTYKCFEFLLEKILVLRKGRSCKKYSQRHFVRNDDLFLHIH